MIRLDKDPLCQLVLSLALQVDPLAPQLCSVGLDDKFKPENPGPDTALSVALPIHEALDLFGKDNEKLTDQVAFEIVTGLIAGSPGPYATKLRSDLRLKGLIGLATIVTTCNTTADDMLVSRVPHEDEAADQVTACMITGHGQMVIVAVPVSANIDTVPDGTAFETSYFAIDEGHPKLMAVGGDIALGTAVMLKQLTGGIPGFDKAPISKLIHFLAESRETVRDNEVLRNILKGKK